MEAISVLFAGRLSPHATAPLGAAPGPSGSGTTGGGPSAFLRAVAGALNFSSSAGVVVLATEGQELPELPEGATVEFSPSWTRNSVLARLAALSTERHLYWAWADTPLLDPALAARIRDRHLRYAAEYSYADGWPAGLAPELLAPGVAELLRRIAGNEDGPVERDLLFSVIQKDINSFDIETEIASTDLRSHRLLLAADCARNVLLLERWLSSGYSGAGDAERLCSAGPALLRTLPAFYAVQVTGGCPQACSLCPYPRFGADTSGLPPLKRRDEMSPERFSELLDRIVAFSGDAVVDLSPWGEPSLHSGIVDLVRSVLARPELSLIIETSGVGWKPGVIAELAAVVAAAPPRLYPRFAAAPSPAVAARDSSAGAPQQGPGDAVSWIVSLDAEDPVLYRSLRGDGREEARAVATELISRFPGCVYVQTLRTTENEADLEPFYRGWKAAGAQVIVQKYDSFCGRLPDLKVADLSPVRRHPCWHLMRDLTVLLDGTVPLCREDLERSEILGNAFSEDLETIWRRGESYYRAHLGEKYPALCRNCDEYYTYNF